MIDVPGSVVCVGDCECVISSLEVSTTKMKPFFHNRVSEIKQNLEDLRKICQVEDFQHISGSLNPADLITREDGKLEEIGIGSEWQTPTFLKKPRDLWPVTRDFIRTGPPVEEQLLQ